MSREIVEYAEALYSADDMNLAFAQLESQVRRLGFDGALYTYIPHLVLDSKDGDKPLYQVSESYVPKYLSHYQEARYDRCDPLIKAVLDGVSTPIDWFGSVCESYMSQSKQSREVISESQIYGVRRGITLPLKSDHQGIAGASFVVTEQCSLESIEQRFTELRTVTSMYHGLVMANAGFIGSFVRPAFGTLNVLEMRFLAGLASGKSIKELAAELFRSRKYLEQVLIRIRTKVGGLDDDGRPIINRDQLLYYAGLANIITEVERLN